MKKQYKVFSVAIAFAMLLPGCAGGNAEKNSEITESTAYVDSSDNTTRISAEDTKGFADTVQSEKPAETAAEEIPESTYTAEFPPSGIDMSNYGGHFYKWEYDKSIVSENVADFSSEDIEAAYSAVNEYFRGLLEGVEKSKEPRGDDSEESYIVTLHIPGYNRQWDYPVYEDDHTRCMEGDCDMEFYKGVCDDFDGDGEEESFFQFRKSNAMYLPLIFTVFVNARGEAVVFENAGLLNGDLNPVRYNGFTHMAVENGYNNSTLHTSIYAVENGEAVLKLTEYSLPENYMDVFMRVRMVQRTGEWLVFWNDEINGYCSVSGDSITDKEAEELFEAYNRKSFTTDEYTGRYKTAQAIQTNTRKIGNIYCIAIDYDYHCFEKSENGFEISDMILTPADEEFSDIFASKVDFDTVAEKTYESIPKKR